MSEFENGNNPEAIEPTPEPKPAAEQYIEASLTKNREILQKTRIIASATAIVLSSYLWYLTANFHANLVPEGAATVATGLAAERLDELEPTFASFIHEQVPQAIRRAPDEVIARMPEFRERLEERVESDLRAHSEEGAKRLSANLDQFFTEHKDEIGEFLKEGQKPESGEKLANALETSFMAFLNEQEINGSTISEKLDNTLSTLEQVETRTAHLARNRHLTASEKKARHAVAMLMQRIDAGKDDGSIAEAGETVKGIATSFHP